VMVSALLLQVVQSYATQTAARGAAIFTVDAVNMVLISVLVFLVLRQVMPIASGLAGGASLNSFGLISRGVGGALRSAGERWRRTRQGEIPPEALAVPYSTVRVGGAIRGAGSLVRGAAVRSRTYVDGKAGTDRLGETWRQMRD
jgi:type IV secretion system protein VirB6